MADAMVASAPNGCSPQPPLNGARVGLVCNPASVDRRLRHIADRSWRCTRRATRGAVRSAARVPIRRAGQHDRDASRARRGAAACRCTRSTARRRASRPPEMLRDLDRARRRSAGRRRPHLHLHLHDGELPEGGAQARPQGDRLRSAESDRRPAGRGAGARSPASSRSSACIRSRCATA